MNSKSDYNLATIERTAITFEKSQLEKERELKRNMALVRKYAYLCFEFDKIPVTEPTRWDMIWAIIRATYKVVKVLYYIFRIYLLFTNLRNEMDLNTKTNIIAGIVAFLTAILLIFGIQIPVEVLTAVVGGILTLILWFTGKKDTKKPEGK